MSHRKSTPYFLIIIICCTVVLAITTTIVDRIDTGVLYRIISPRVEQPISAPLSIPLTPDSNTSSDPTYSLPPQITIDQELDSLSQNQFGDLDELESIVLPPVDFTLD